MQFIFKPLVILCLLLVSSITSTFGSNLEDKPLEKDWRTGLKLCAGDLFDPIAYAESRCLATLSPVGSGWWNDPAQWNLGRVPTSNDVVVIPAGATIHLRGNCNAKNITINGRIGFIPNASFNLNTEWILVNGANAQLDLGHEGNPIKGKGTITLKGGDDGDNIMGMGDKFIAAMNGGIIRLIGQQKLAWTQLGATANQGANQITLKENVDWQVGDKIVIASTDFDMNHAEVRTITAVAGNQVTLNEPLIYKHFGKLQTYTRPDDPSLTWTLDERAEVGLLSRNLTVQGDESSDATGFGGHIMAMSGATLVGNNVELFRMGQKAKLGRYPWHWHLLGNNGQGQYLRNSSIHQTYNRAVTIHSTNGTRVERNVAYNNLGHAYFFEDGNEINNIMQYNLGLVTRRPAAEDALLPSDIDNRRNMSGPATFWITHPLNKINFNHAAGSDGSGIWFAPHQNANSAAFDPTVQPNNIPVPDGNWDNNVAHSSTHGLLVGPTVFANDVSQKVNPNLDYYPSGAPGNTVIKVKNYTLFKNLLGTYLRVGQNARDTYWENFIIADNYKGDALTWAGEQHKFLWVGGSENYESHPSGNDKAIGGAPGLVHLHTIYDGPTRVYDSYFADVDYPEMSLFDQWGANIKYTGQTFRNTTVAPGSFNVNWRNFPNRPAWNNATVYDVDGQLTGTPMTAMHLDIPILRNETTTLINTNQNGAKSNNRYAYVEVIPADENLSNKRQASVTTRSDGAIQTDNLIEIQGVSIVPILDKGYTYTLRYKDYLPWRNQIDYYSMNTGEDMILGFPGAPATTTAFLGATPGKNTRGAKLPELSSLEELKNTNQTAYAFEGTTFYVKYIAGANSQFEDIGAQNTVLVYTNDLNQTNIPYPDTDGDGYTDIIETEQCRNPYNASDLAFNFNNSREGFQTNQIDAQVLNNNNDFWLLRADNRNDPFILSPDLKFSSNSVQKIFVAAQSQTTGTFQLYFKTASSNFYSANKVVTVNYTTANTRKTLEFNVANHTAWNNQTITGLRLDFPVNASINSHTWLWEIYGENPQREDCTPYEEEKCVIDYVSFSNTVTNEAWTAKLGNSISITPVSGSTFCGGTNQFTVKRTGNENSGFADFHYLSTTAADWSEYDFLSIKMCGGAVPYQVFIKDSSVGHSLLGKAPVGGDYTFNLPNNLDRKDQVDDILIRVLTNDLALNQSVTFSLSSIQLGINGEPCQETPETLAGTYSIISKRSNKALSLYGWTQNNGGNIIQWEYLNYQNQHWILEHLGDEVYTITSKHSSNAVDVSNISQNNGANIHQWNYVGGDNQKWKIQPVGNGYYRLLALHSGKALSVNGSRTTNGTNIHQWEYVDVSSQKWRFDKIAASRSKEEGHSMEVFASKGRNAEVQFVANQAFKPTQYHIQHSTDKVNFATISSLPASDVPNLDTYQFTDESPHDGQNYYQVVVEYDEGNQEIIPAQSLDFAVLAGGISVFPNPTKESLYLNLSNYSKVALQYKILNLQGKVMDSGQFEKNHAAVEILDLETYQNGSYFIYLQPENRQGITQKFMVMKEY